MRTLRAITGAVVCLGVCPLAAGDIILGVTASTDMGSGFGTDIQNTVNGVGLPGGIPDLNALHEGTSPANSWVSDFEILTGTVTFDVAKAIGEIRKGRVEYRVEKAGIVHVAVGKVSFEAQQLYENAQVVLESVMKAKPASSKGRYLKSATLSSTVGPGIRLDATAISKQWS